MPVIGISVKQLNHILGQSLTPDKLSETLEKLGCDLEGIGEINIYQCPNCNNLQDKMVEEEAVKKCNECSYESQSDFCCVGQDTVIRLDLLPARPDYFDAGGLSRAIKGYLDIETGLPKYETLDSDVLIEIDPRVEKKESYRPYIVCAIVRIPPIDSVLLRTLMKLQENLHWGIGRDRKLSSIGVHDFSMIRPPIRYTVVGPEEIKFCPLFKPGIEMTPAQVLTDHPKGIAYAHLLSGLEAYPMLIDSTNDVLSMPPIINSEKTKLKVGTSELFIDVTGTTSSDVVKTLHTLTTSLIELGGKVETVIMKSVKEEWRTPNLSSREIKVSAKEASKWLGIELKEEDFTKYLHKMRFGVSGNYPEYVASYPAFRTDIKHEVDVFEDIAIAYDYAKMDLTLVPTMTIGKERPEEKISQVTRDILLGLGFDEIFSLMITTHLKHFNDFLMDPSQQKYALLQNPKTSDYNVVRSHLMTGLLECIAKNSLKAMPQKYFEIGNVVLLDPEMETQTREERRVIFAITGPQAGYAQIRASLDSVLYELGKIGKYRVYGHASFLPNRCAQVDISDGLSAYLGEIHPQVLQNFGLSQPVALCEITIARVIPAIVVI